MSGDDDRGTAPPVMTQRGCSKQVAVDCDWHLTFSFGPLCTEKVKCNIYYVIWNNLALNSPHLYPAAYKIFCL